MAFMGLTAPTGVMAGEGAALSPEEIERRMHVARPDIPVESIKESSLNGFYEVVIAGGQTTLYVTEDGKHFIAGDLYRIAESGFVNLSEESRKQARKERISAIDDSEKVVFSPPADQVKATINVFTDVDCGFCRKLHREISELNELGIAVKYLAYPREGIHSATYDKTVSAWCADNPREALTQAKQGKPIAEKSCDNPVAEHYQLGKELGVTGTPSIILSDGTMQPGYLPAKKMAERLGLE